MTPNEMQKSFLPRLQKGVSVIEDSLNIISMLLVMFIMFFVTAEVVGRYVFNHPIPGHLEIVELLLPALVFLGLSYTERVGGHIRIDAFIDKFKGKRLYHLLDFFGLIICLALFIVFAVYTSKEAVFAYEEGDATSYYLIPTWEAKTCIAVGCLLMCIRLGIELVQSIAQIFGKDTWTQS